MKKIITIIPSAYSGKAFGDINKYIEYYKDEFQVVVISKKYNDPEIEIDGVKYIRPATSKADYYIFVSEYKIDAGSLNVRHRISDKQKWVSIWHGTPYKNMFIDLDEKELEPTMSYSHAYDLMISPSRWYSERFLRQSMLYDGEIVEIGSSRTDNLFLTEDQKSKIKSDLEIDKQKKVILYAPTYRDAGEVADLKINASKILEILGEDYVLVVKLHYLNTLAYTDNNIIDATNYDNVNNLLAVTDLLITDYSSLFFDYSVISDKIVFYQYDFEEYSKDRGFKFDLAEYVDSEFICKTESELYNALSNFNNITNSLKKNFYPHADGKDTVRIAEKIKFIPEDRKFEEVIFLVNELNNIGGVANYIKLMAKSFKEKYNSRIIVMGIKEFLHAYENVVYFEDENVDIMISSEKFSGACKTILKETNGLIITTQFSSQLHFQEYMKDKNVVLMFHGDIQMVIDKNDYKWHMDALNSNRLYNYKKLALLTESNVEAFKDHYVHNDRLTFMYNPFEYKFDDLHKESGIFVAVTRLDEDKNPFEYIKIFEREDLNSNFKLEIYGDGKLKDKMEKEIQEKNLSGKIKLMGYCDNKETMYANKQGFVFTPKSEGFGYVILEAYSYGIPVYCYNASTAIEDLITENTGRIIENHNIDQFVKELNNGFSRNEKTIEDFKMICDKSNPDKIISNWVDIYNEITKQSSVPKKLQKINYKNLFVSILKKIYFRIDTHTQMYIRSVYQRVLEIIKLKKINSYQKTQPLISIIMPYFNDQDTVESAIKSVVRQKYKNVEIVIVNDGCDSFDEALLKKYPQIRYYKKENSGPGLTRNYGIEKATGEFVLYLDADDILARGSISLLVDFALRNKVDVVCGKKLRVEFSNRKNSHVWMYEMYIRSYVNKYNDRQLLLNETTSTGILYNRKKLLESGIQFETGLYEDKVYMSHIFSHFEKIGILKEHIYIWYLYGNNTSITSTIDMDNFRERIKRCWGYFDVPSEVFKFHYYSFVVNHDLKILINNYSLMNDEQKDEIYETYKSLSTTNIKYNYDRNITKIINKRLLKYAIEDNKNKFDLIANMYSKNYNEQLQGEKEKND